MNISNDNTKISNILKESLKIIDELSNIDTDERDLKSQISDLIELINRAKRLKKNRLWKLK